MDKEKKDDLDAVREVVAILQVFSSEEQKRIIKWAGEKLGVSIELGDGGAVVLPVSTPASFSKAQDIKTFVESKNPKTDKQFAAVVAYYYQFEASEKKDAISKDDLINATRMANWDRLSRPDQTLVNATNAGFLDNVSRGRYSLNSVGENLVAMALPSHENVPKASPSRKKYLPKNKLVSKRGKRK